MTNKRQKVSLREVKISQNLSTMKKKTFKTSYTCYKNREEIYVIAKAQASR